MALRHPDIWSQEDLALASALCEIKHLDALPTNDEQQAQAGAWAPWRSVAARVLWMHYLAARGQYQPPAVIDWLTDRSSVLIWFTSIVSGALMVLTLFGNKPGFQDLNSTALSISLLMMFFSILCNLMCVWQIPKWKLAIRTGRISNGRRMTLEREISSWLGLVSFLGALVMAALGNSGL